MKILDRYLIKSFIVPFFVCVLIFCVLVVLGRFFDKMEIFVRFHAHLKDIVAFLVLGLPFWLNLVLPVATMLALLFSLGQLYQRGEFTAFRSAGIPSWRLYSPFVGIGFLLAIVSLVGGLTFLPKLNFQSRTQNFSYALALAFFYWGVTSVCQSFGEQGQMPAWLSAWMSNFIFIGFAGWKLTQIA